MMPLRLIVGVGRIIDRHFERDTPFNIAHFYRLPKIHKPKSKNRGIPPLRPVVTIVDTIDSIFGNYIDYKLKPIMIQYVDTMI